MILMNIIFIIIDTIIVIVKEYQKDTLGIWKTLLNIIEIVNFCLVSTLQNISF